MFLPRAAFVPLFDGLHQIQGLLTTADRAAERGCYLRHLRDPVKARRYLAHYRRLGGDDPEILRWLATKK